MCVPKETEAPTQKGQKKSDSKQRAAVNIFYSECSSIVTVLRSAIHLPLKYSTPFSPPLKALKDKVVLRRALVILLL